MKDTRILLAGATGYLGGYITQNLIESGYETRLIVRNKSKTNFDKTSFEIFEGQVTNPKSITGCCNGIDIVISTIGITRQKDGLTYMDVDYQANLNLLQEAKKAGVKKFIYISVFNGEKFRNLKICEAKEKFVDELKSSGLDYCIIRPNGFFSDMKDFLEMAKKGKVYLFGDGMYKFNPVHGEDLAKVCVDAIVSSEAEIEIGGPETLSQNDIATIALKAAGKKVKILHLPDWIRKFTLWSVRTFTSSKTYGPLEFFLTLMATDMIAPQYGNHKLEDFYKECVN